MDGIGRAEVGPPAGEGWLGLDAVVETGLERLFEAARSATTTRRPDYVGASVAAALADALVGTAVPALLVERRLPHTAPRNVSVLLPDSELWFERVAVHRPHGYVLAADPAADHPEVTPVATLHDLHRQLASLIVEAVSPWFAAIRERAPFGRRGMWGQLADHLCGTALWTARVAKLDQRRAWDEAQAVLDLIAESVPELRVRPRLFPVRWRGGETLCQVKGTCCLWYTTFDQPDIRGDGYCVTCPLRPDAVRVDRLRHWLDSEAESAG
ncbi:MAG: hypothetical protein M3P85_08850 [Actinomycetota bacterium]|nr:hypothetical protein [Actinomycetota bacterium]